MLTHPWNKELSNYYTSDDDFIIIITDTNASLASPPCSAAHSLVGLSFRYTLLERHTEPKRKLVSQFILIFFWSSECIMLITAFYFLGAASTISPLYNPCTDASSNQSHLPWCDPTRSIDVRKRETRKMYRKTFAWGQRNTHHVCRVVCGSWIVGR